MKAKDIQLIIGKRQVLKYHSPVCENIKDLFSGWEFDVMSISKTGFVYEFEVKVSKSDFNNDKKKVRRYSLNGDGTNITKHEFYSIPSNKDKVPNYYSYVCPKGLIQLNEISASTGLYYIDGESVIEVQKPKLLHNHIHDSKKIMEKVCRLMCERQFLGCARLTYENRILTERNKNYKTTNDF